MTVTDSGIIWMPVCRLDELTPDRGAAALVDGHPVAVFYLAATPTSEVALFAVDHVDPATGFGVIARGLIGSTGDCTFVVSPLHKQRYDLGTGCCLDEPTLALRTWPVRVHGGVVEVGREAMRSST